MIVGLSDGSVITDKQNVKLQEGLATLYCLGFVTYLDAPRRSSLSLPWKSHFPATVPLARLALNTVRPGSTGRLCLVSPTWRGPSITRDAQLHRMKPEQWTAVINTNLGSLFNMTRQVIEGMRERKFGLVLLAADDAGLITGSTLTANGAHYIT